MRSPDVLLDGCRISSATPAGAQHYFGFHDVSPWDANDELIALLRVPAELRRTPAAGDVAEICLWNPVSGQMEPVGTTRAFNWQQGSRLQWLPGRAGKLISNDLEERRPVSRVYDVETGKWGTVLPAVYAVDPVGIGALSPDFAHLSRCWRDYSYATTDPSPHPAGREGSLSQTDLKTGAETLLIDVREARELCGQTSGNAAGRDFISHPTFSPSGSRIAFMYRRFANDGALFSFFLTAQADGSELCVLGREKCSHFDWLDDDRVLLWTRKLPRGAGALRGRGWTRRFPMKQAVAVIRRLSPRLKQGLFAEMYYLLDCRNPAATYPLAPGVLEQDGHPMFNAARDWMVTDTYAFQGFQPLILFSLCDETRHDIVKFPVHPDFTKPALKCDLHPRWNRAGNKIAVDSAHTGQRQLYVIDASDFLSRHAT
jgi:hypothetical protein